MNICYKFRLYPTREQTVLISKTFGCARFIYNTLLASSEANYFETGKHSINTPASYKGEFLWLKEVDSLALCNAQLNLDKAYKTFFNNLKKHKKSNSSNPYGFPKFKSRKDSKQSYTTNNLNNSIRIEDGKLRLPKLGLVKTVFHRRIVGVIKGVTVSKNSSGKYFVSILTEKEDVKQLPIIGTGKERVLGIDFSFHDLMVTSDGEKTNPPKWYYDQEKKISKLNRELHRKVLGSQNREKARLKLARAYEEMTFKKDDYLHKLSHRLVNEFDVIALEDIDLAAMKKCLNFGKAISSLGFGKLRTFMEYKAKWNGKLIWYADRFFPSTQLCSVCGYQNKELKDLSIREWICPICGTKHDRDINSGVNLKQEYFRTLASGGIYACGDTASIDREFLSASGVDETGKVEELLISQAVVFRQR